MQTIESQKIVTRFFEAIYDLKARKVIRGKQNKEARGNKKNPGPPALSSVIAPQQCFYFKALSS